MAGPKFCPACRQLNPPTAQRCDCGYDFTGKSAAGGVHTVAEIELIAGGQRWVIFGVILSLALSLLFPLQLLALPVLWVGIWRMTTGLKLSAAGRTLYMVGVVIPVVPLLVLFALNGRATRALQAAGVRVGLFGAKSADVAALKAKQSSAQSTT